MSKWDDDLKRAKYYLRESERIRKEHAETIGKLREEIANLKKDLKGAQGDAYQWKEIAREPIFTGENTMLIKRLDDAMLEIERLMGYVAHHYHCNLVQRQESKRVMRKVCTCGLDKKEESDEKGGSGKAD